MKSPHIPPSLYIAYYFVLAAILILAVAIRQEYENRHPQPTGAPVGFAAQK